MGTEPLESAGPTAGPGPPQRLEELERFAEALSQGVLLVDSEGRIAGSNAAIETLFGYSREELTGLPVDLLVPEGVRDDHGARRAAFTRSATRRRMGEGRDLPARRKDGSEFPAEIELSPVETHEGSFVLVTVSDMTERLAVVAAAQRREAQLRRQADALEQQAALLNLAPVRACDMDDRIVLWSAGSEHLFGYTADEALGRIAHELLRTEFGEPLCSIFETLERDGVWEGELVQRARDGARVVVAARWVLHRDADGEPRRILATSTDITARRAAEAAERISAAQLWAALDVGNVGSYSVDMVTGQVSGDANFCTVMGRTAEEINALYVRLDDPGALSWIHPDDRAGFIAARTAFVNDETPDLRTEYRLLLPSGGEKWIAIRGRIERDAAGRPLRMVGAAADIGDRKREEASRVRSEKLQALGTLAGGIAHDFNNILHAIAGNAALARADIPYDHPAQQELAEIERAGARAADLVRRILSFARPGSPRREAIELKPVVEEALYLLRSTLPAGIQLRTSFSLSPLTVDADATQVHLMLMNIVANAAHAIGQGPGEIEVRLDRVAIDGVRPEPDPGLPAGRYALISVTDDGEGMPEETLARIFDPFFTTKQAAEGTGLGLSAVHGIMQTHGGAVTVVSEPGAGTAFGLYLPLVAPPADPLPDPDEPGGERGRILLVDDEPALVRLHVLALGRLGFEVTGRTDPEEALALFRTDPDAFDALVTDLLMPGLSGIDLAREVLALRPLLPVVLVSGHLGSADHEAARSTGIAEVLQKPSGAESLAQLLDRLCAAREN